MIDFACKQFVIDDIIKCSFGLSKSELFLFHFLSSHDTFFTTHELAKAAKLDVSTVQRAVKKLFDQEVLERRQSNLDGGGYVFSYAAIEHTLLEEKIMSRLSIWLSRVQKELKHWPT